MNTNKTPHEPAAHEGFREERSALRGGVPSVALLGGDPDTVRLLNAGDHLSHQF